MSDILTIYNQLKTLTIVEAVEYIVSRINVCDLAMLEGFADFDELSELAYEIFLIRCPK